MNFRLDNTGNVTTITLPPRRNLPVTRVYGLLIAAAAVGIPVGAVLMFSWQVLRTLLHTWHLVVGLFSLFSYGIGLVMTGEVTLTLDGETLTSFRRAGPFTSKTAIAMGTIARLELDVPDLLRRSVLPNNTSLNAELANGARIAIVQGYPRELLVELAEYLATLIHPVEAEAASEQAAASGVEVVDVSGVPPIARDVLTQPAKSLITSARVGEMQTYVVKRFGNVRHPVEFALINLVVLVLLALAVGLTVFFVWEWRRRAMPAWAFVIAMGADVLLAAALAWNIHVFFRKCILVASPSGLTRMTRGPLRKTERHLERAEIVGIRTEGGTHKSFKVSGAMNVSLVATLRSGEKVKLLWGPELDLRWLATELRRELGVPLRG